MRSIFARAFGSHPSSEFEFAMGSRIGWDHVFKGINNQDGHFLLSDQNVIIGVVADGCTSKNFSEVGALLGAPVIGTIIGENALAILSRDANSTVFSQAAFWERCRQDALAKIRELARSMGSSLTQVVFDYFLFTVLGVLITPKISVFVSIGDGIEIVNSDIMKIGPFPDNEPPYFGHGLLEPGQVKIDQALLRFRIQKIIATDQLVNFLIGSDGVNYLLKAVDKNVPGQQQKVGLVSQFWTEDIYFKNPAAVTMRLNLLSRETQSIDYRAQRVTKYAAILRDDTTLIAGRRKRK